MRAAYGSHTHTIQNYPIMIILVGKLRCWDKHMVLTVKWLAHHVWTTCLFVWKARLVCWFVIRNHITRAQKTDAGKGRVPFVSLCPSHGCFSSTKNVPFVGLTWQVEGFYHTSWWNPGSTLTQRRVLDDALGPGGLVSTLALPCAMDCHDEACGSLHGWSVPHSTSAEILRW